MLRRSNARASFIPRRLNNDDLLADGFLDAFGEHFKSYRNGKSRERLLSGIHSDARYGKMRVRDAIIFILTLSAAREWQGSHLRQAKYIRARHLSKFNRAPPAYMPPDVPQAQRQNRATERNRVEALVALGFARSSGYPTHSRALWRCIDGAIRTDGLGEPAKKVVRTDDYVDTYFEWVRSRLNYLYAKHGKASVEREADKVFARLSSKLQRTALVGATLYDVLHAKHREV